MGITIFVEHVVRCRVQLYEIADKTEMFLSLS